MKAAVTRDEGVAALKTDGKGRTSLDIPWAFIKEKDDEGLELRFQNDQGEDIVKTTVYECYDKVGFLSLPLGQEVVNALVLSSGNQSFYYVYVAGLPKALKAVVNGTLTTAFVHKEESPATFKDQEVGAAEPAIDSPKLAQGSEPKKAGAALLVKILLACVSLLVFAALIWWFFLREGEAQKNIAADPAATQKEQPAVVAKDNVVPQSKNESNICKLGFSQDDKALLDACMASKPSDEELLKLASASFAKGRCMIGTRIYSSLGRTGAKGAALAYARFFDPKSNQQSDCVKKDGSQAKYWYEKSLKSSDPEDVNQAREALKP